MCDRRSQDVPRCSQIFSNVLRMLSGVHRYSIDALRCSSMLDCKIPSIHCRIIFGKYWQDHSHLAKSLFQLNAIVFFKSQLHLNVFLSISVSIFLPSVFFCLEGVDSDLGMRPKIRIFLNTTIIITNESFVFHSMATVIINTLSQAGFLASPPRNPSQALS